MPDHGLGSLLTRTLYGDLPEKWFTPLRRGEARPALEYRLANRVILDLLRLRGITVPPLEPVGLDEAHTVARWAAYRLRETGTVVLRGAVSRAVRVCLAAQEEGLDLTGLRIYGGGEPPTPAKVAQMTAVGAHFVPAYHFTEVGAVALGCAAPCDENDLHLLRDHLALIQHPREIPGFDRFVDTFHFTTLRSTAPKILLNVESDDFGVVEERTCGCRWEELGFTQHVRGIASFGKLTGEGMTLVGSDMVRILEEVLPRTFGGSSLDYQLLEEEDRQGLTRMSLLVHPRLSIDDEEEISRTVLRSIESDGGFAGLAGAIWAQGGTLQVRREEPRLTSRGKFFPLSRARAAAEDRQARAASR